MEPGTRPQRIGVIVPPRPRLNEAALQSFVLAMNKEQSLIQFEFYKTGTLHPLMAVFSTKRKPVDRDWLFDDGKPELLAAVSHLVDREWLGSSADPRSPAGISANLGADLFIVKGLRATPRERLINTFREESVKQIAVAVGVIAAAAALFFLLGIKG